MLAKHVLPSGMGQALGMFNGTGPYLSEALVSSNAQVVSDALSTRPASLCLFQYHARC